MDCGCGGGGPRVRWSRALTKYTATKPTVTQHLPSREIGKENLKKIQLSANAMDPEEVKVVGKEVISSKVLLQLGRIITNLVFSFVVYGARNLQPKKGYGE